ncbi:hypothetical protein LCGC14_3100650 [marine sediment metagenome]|uniref:Uncharacterized protein n=1 Tax=marine sediment metagenome TaxID=412755 RepID=A0A0F8WWT9_9ZZZZ
MKVTLSKTSPDRGGDIMSLARLLSTLKFMRDFHYPEDREWQVVLDLWIEYLEGIENHLLAANMGRVKEKSVFDLPFEKDFSERIGEAE